jgi:xanthine dehydrogenase iron-sulfur cluster and FAD-binding subunit A
VKPRPFTYHRPATVEEATSMLAELDGESKVLAGGQSLIPLMNFRLASPDHLVDVNRVAGLDTIDVGNGAVRVGATVRHTALERDTAAHDANPLLREALNHVAHAVIRNRGTAVGSIVHGDPAAELPAVLALLGGSLTVAARRGRDVVTRDIAAADLFVGPLTTAVESDELAVAATFPALGLRTGWALVEVTRRHGDYAIAGVATTVTLDDGGEVVDARAAYLSCASVPVVLDLTEAAGDATALAARVSELLSPTGDIHASADYRRHLAAVLTLRAVDLASRRATEKPRDPTEGNSEGKPTAIAFGSSNPHPTEGEGERKPTAIAFGSRTEDVLRTSEPRHDVSLTVNGEARAVSVPARRLLSDCIRHDLGLTGTHVGCEHGVCGACTVLVGGQPVRSCLTFAVMVDGAEVTTVEGLAGDNGELSPVQRAFKESHGLQCGFCTPGFLLLTTHLLSTTPNPDDEDITETLAGNLCRCTGYAGIERSVKRAVELVAEHEAMGIVGRER